MNAIWCLPLATVLSAAMRAGESRYRLSPPPISLGLGVLADTAETNWTGVGAMLALGAVIAYLIFVAVRQRRTERQAMEAIASVRAQAQRMSGMANVLTHIRDAVMIADLNGNITTANPAAERLLGVSADALVGQPIARFLPVGEPNDHASVQQRVLSAEKVHPFEGEALAADGSRLPVEMSLDLNLDANGQPTGICAIMRTIGEREERLYTVLESLPMGVFAHNLDGAFVLVNEAACRATGWSREELLRMSVADVDPGSVTREDRERLWLGLKAGESVHLEATHTRKDGTTYPASLQLNAITLDGQPIILCVAFDLSERERANAALRESEARYRALFENMAQGAFYQEADGALIDANPMALELFGLTRDQFLGKTSMHPDWRVVREDGSPLPGEEHPSMVALSTGRPVKDLLTGVYNPRRQDFVWLAINAIPQFREGQDEPYGVFVTLHDMTDRKQQEEILAARLRLAEYSVGHTVPELLQEFLNEVEALTHSQTGFYHFVDETSESISLQAWSTHTLDRHCQVELPPSPYSISDAGVWIDCVRTRAPVIHNDYASLPHKKGLPPGHVQVIRELVVPVIREGRIVAILGVGNKAVDYDQADLETVQRLADLAWETVVRRQAETEREQAIEALEKSEQGYRTLIESQPDIVGRVDREGRHLFVSENVQEVSGVPAREYIGKTHRELGYPETQCDIWEQHFQQVMASGEPVESEYTIERDGRQRVFDWRLYPERDAQGTVQSILLISRDITERRDEEQERRYLAEIVEKSLDEIYVFDEETLRFEYANRGARKNIQYTMDELRQLTPMDIKPEFDEASFRAAIAPLIDGEQPFLVFQTIHERADGSRYPVDVHLQRVPYRDRRVLVAMIFDITERLEAERALRASEQKHRVFLENLHGIAYDTVHPTFYPTFFYGIVSEITGYTSEDFISKRVRWIDLVHPEDVAHVRETGNRLCADPGYVGDSEYRIRHKNGEIRWVRDIARATRTPDAQINSVQGVLYDVTERVYAEEAVRKSEAALIEAQAVAHVGSWTYDVAQDRLSWSDEMYRLYGLDPSIGEPNWPLKSQRIHPDDWEHLNRLFGETLAHGTPYHCEFRIIRPNGELAWVEMIGRPDLAADGSVARLSGTLQDITERKFAEQALRESEANLRQIIDTSPNGIFVKDREGRYVLVNKTVAALYGGQDAMLGKTDRELADVKVFAADDALAFVADDLEVMETLQPKGIPEMRFVGADGAERWFQTTKVPLLTDSGPVGVLGVSVDITERKLAEQERERLVTQLAQAQRMEAVGRLAGGVAHDFNNMLAVILGRSELALDLIHEADPIREELVEIERAAQRSANLTRQLLAFARRQTILPQVLDLNETMAGMLKMMQRLIGENIRLVWRPGADLWPVKIDPSQVDQISANLCVNARDAIDGVGQVTVETHNVAIDDAYCLEHAECVPGEYVQLAVSDDGCGMDQEVLGHLFEPFFTTKGVGEGTGLGLPTIYGIVKQNEGFVNVYSEPGVGSTFRIYLPRHIVEEEQQTAAQDTATSEIRGHETILLVEDEAAILRLSQTILEHLGYHVLTAATPGRALTIANAHPHAIHLLITDVIMPEMNGHDLAEQLTARYPEMRCLFTSGYTADVIASHGVLDAEVAFIAKPYTRRAFAARVRQVLDKR